MSLTTRQSRMLGTSDGAAASVAPAVLGIKSVRTSQPQQAVGIDWGNPITRGLVVANNPLSLDVIGVKGNRIGRWTTNPSEPGSPVNVMASSVGFVIDSTHDEADLTASGVNIADSDAFTVFSLTKQNAYDMTRSFLARGKDGFGDGWSINLGSNPDGSLYGKLVLTSGGAASFVLNGTSNQIGRFSAAVLTYNPTDTVAGLYVNGIKEAETITGKTGLRNSDKGLVLGGSTSVLANWYYYTSYAHISLQAVWNRALSDKEVKSISENPWQIFLPLNRQVWVAA